MNNIYLIGMPGCGKSTIGRLISSEMDMEFLDLDDYIEEQTGKSIPELFKVGERHFRDCEAACLEKVSAKEGIIVATGGGIIETEGNADMMQKSGKVIFIHTTPERIMENSALDGRPLLAENKNRIFELYDRRYEKYKAAAHVTVENMGSLDETVSNVINKIKK